MPTPNPLKYLVAVMGVFILTLGAYFYIKISSLETKLLTSQNKGLECKIQSNIYESSLDEQTSEIEHLRVDYNNSITKYNKIRIQPAKIKYKEIIKYLPSKEIVKRGSCEDINEYFSNLNNLDLDSL